VWVWVGVGGCVGVCGSEVWVLYVFSPSFVDASNLLSLWRAGHLHSTVQTPFLLLSFLWMAGHQHCTQFYPASILSLNGWSPALHTVLSCFYPFFKWQVSSTAHSFILLLSFRCMAGLQHCTQFYPASILSLYGWSPALHQIPFLLTFFLWLVCFLLGWYVFYLDGHWSPPHKCLIRHSPLTPCLLQGR